MREAGASLDGGGAAEFRARRHPNHNVVQQAERLVARQFGMEPADMRKWPPGRPSRRELALARRTVVYLAVVASGVSRRRVAMAVGVGETAVRNALRAIEDLRDDPVFDAWIETLSEQVAA